MKMAVRIQARAIRRCGELLKQIEPQSMGNLKQNRGEAAHTSVVFTRTEAAESAGGTRTDVKPTDAADSRLTRKSAAEQAGLSERQQYTALRVANVPKDEFNESVESDNPPTLQDDPSDV